MKEIALPSGAKLGIGDTPFATSKNLCQVVLEELKIVKINSTDDISNLVKDAFCTAFSSPKIEIALKPCLERCTYNGVKITEATWEPITARADYLKVCAEVGKHNVDPFLSGLYADYKTALTTIAGILK